MKPICLLSLLRFAVVVLIALAATGCRSTDCAAHTPWGDAKETRAYLDTYKHVLVVCVYEDHWEDRGFSSLHHFKATVVRTYKGDWNIGERIALVHRVDAPASTETNGEAGSLKFLFTSEHTEEEISYDTGDFGHCDSELERGLQCAFAGQKPDGAQDALRVRASTRPKLTLAHNIQIPKEWSAGSENPGMPDCGTAERYVSAYDRGWWIAVQRYAEDINFDDPSPLVMNGWAEEAYGGQVGYGSALDRIEELIRVYGKQRVSEYLQQFRLPDEKPISAQVALTVMQGEKSNVVFRIKNSTTNVIRLPSAGYVPLDSYAPVNTNTADAVFRRPEVKIGLWLTHDWRQGGTNWMFASRQEWEERLKIQTLKPGDTLDVVRSLGPWSDLIQTNTNAAASFEFLIPQDFATEYDLWKGYLCVTGITETIPPSMGIPADVAQVLHIYAQLTGAQLDVDDGVRQLPTVIRLGRTPAMTRQEACELIEKMLREQAGVLVTHLDASHIRITKMVPPSLGFSANVAQVLDIYTKLTGAQLDVDDGVRQLPTVIHFGSTPAMTLQAACELVDKALREQAGVLVTHLDASHIKVSLQPSFVPDDLAAYKTGVVIETIPHDACATNMLQLALWLRIAIGEGYRFPASLASLAVCTNYPNFNNSLLVCPTTGHVPGAISNAEAWTDYIYVGNGDEGGMCDVALLISPPENHGGEYGYVAWGCGNVGKLPAAAVRSLIKAPWCLPAEARGQPKVRGDGFDKFVKPGIKIRIPARFASIYGTNSAAASRP